MITYGLLAFFGGHKLRLVVIKKHVMYNLSELILWQEAHEEQCPFLCATCGHDKQIKDVFLHFWDNINFSDSIRLPSLDEVALLQ